MGDKGLLAVSRMHPNHPVAVDGPKPTALRPEEAALVQLFILLENFLLAGLILRVISDRLFEYYQKPLENKFSKAGATKSSRSVPQGLGGPIARHWAQPLNQTFRYRSPPPFRNCRPRVLSMTLQARAYAARRRPGWERA
jgi:hypothetical protein